MSVGVHPLIQWRVKWVGMCSVWLVMGVDVWAWMSVKTLLVWNVLNWRLLGRSACLKFGPSLGTVDSAVILLPPVQSHYQVWKYVLAIGLNKVSHLTSLHSLCWVYSVDFLEVRSALRDLTVDTTYEASGKIKMISINLDRGVSSFNLESNSQCHWPIKLIYVTYLLNRMSLSSVHSSMSIFTTMSLFSEDEILFILVM